MNKRFLHLLLLFVVFGLAVCGCGTNTSSNSESGKSVLGKKTYTCTKEEVDEDGYKTNYTMKITVKNDIVKTVDYLFTSETDPEYVDFQVSVGSGLAELLNNVNGIDASYVKASDNLLKSEIKVDYGKLNPEDVKNALGDFYSEDDGGIYNSKDLSFEQFKKNNLDGYTC